jgi:hypothetical protein
MSTPDPRSQKLAELSGYAHRLGVVFGAEAERAADIGRKIEYFQLFDRCFFGVRMAITLELRLRRESAWAAPADREILGAEHERPETLDRSETLERPDTEREERDPPERDRESDRERASLPLLLKTLSGVAADAAALPGPEPAALPALRELLAHMAGPAAPAARLAPAGALRSRLAGSTTVPTQALSLPRPSRPASPLRRATGPPRR